MKFLKVVVAIIVDYEGKPYKAEENSTLIFCRSKRHACYEVLE